MPRNLTRAIVLFIVAIFALTALALPIAAIWQDSQDNKKSANPPKEDKMSEEKMKDFTPVAQPQDQLQKTDLKPGDGPEVKAGATITADYVGALMSNGVVFDASAKHGGPVSFPLSGVIAGWSQGIPGMKVGGTRRLLIPAALAYGPQSQPGIPANSDLVFDVTVTKIN